MSEVLIQSDILSARDVRLLRALNWGFPILRFIFRIRFRDLEKIPNGPCLLVANHNIGAAIEILALLYAWESRFHFSYSRPLFGLGHRFAFRIPGLGLFMKKIGSVPAEYESAEQVLRSGHSLGIFPGGLWEAARPFSQRREADFGARRGWLRIARRAGVPVVPITVSGSHGVNPVLYRSRRAAKLLLLERFLGVKWFPITVGQILWAVLFAIVFRDTVPLPVVMFGAFVCFVMTPLIPIWPSAITISVGDPINSSGDEELVAREVQEAIRARL